MTGSTLRSRLNRIEARLGPAVTCSECGDGARFRWVFLRDDEPSPEPVCLVCGRPVPMRVIHIVGVDPEDV